MKSTQTNSIPAYPLQWPVSVPRTKAADRQRSRFAQKPWNNSLRGLRNELRSLGATNEVISTNQPIRRDGEPFAQERRIDDPGVAVYFQLDGNQVCFPCDRWLTITENFRAITLHIETMRAQQRYGVGTARQAFAGYKALTAVAGEGEAWWLVLDVPRTATEEQILAAHRALAKRAHPDAGGSADQMARINTARDRALAEKGGR
jgi:hypothetical protein